jgi:hypothetical protein
MPLPTFVFIAFAVGVACALAGGSELRLSPRHALLTSCFRAYALFLCLLLLPASAYFYAFHGDWFLLYVVDVRGFLLGAALARSQRTHLGYGIVGAAVVAAGAVVAVWPDRLAVVGTFAQYRGDFGLHGYGGPLLRGGVAMGALLIGGIAYLLVRIRISMRRG